MSQKFHKYPTLNSEHNWEGLYTQWRTQQTCTSDNRNYIIYGRSNFQFSLRIFVPKIEIEKNHDCGDVSL